MALLPVEMDSVGMRGLETHLRLSFLTVCWRFLKPEILTHLSCTPWRFAMKTGLVWCRKRAFLTQHHRNMGLENVQVVQDQGFIAALGGFGHDQGCLCSTSDSPFGSIPYHWLVVLLATSHGENHLHRSDDLLQSRHLVQVAAEHGVEDSLEGRDNLQDPPRDGSSSYKPFGICDSRVLTSCCVPARWPFKR
jgi:hypothetical protein